jgi:hypothetical protein
MSSTHQRFRSDKRRKKIREDQRYLEARARRLLGSYLDAGDREKQQYYEVIAGAAAACHPSVSDPRLEDVKIAQASAEAAIKIFKFRAQEFSDANDRLAQTITDAYATVAIAYRRAAAVYILNKDMQKLGTAAVHLVTIANSYIAAQSGELSKREDAQ